MRAPLLFLAVVLSHGIAAESATPSWLVALRPELVRLGHDAEIATLCGQYRRAQDGATVLSALDTLASRGLEGLDASFAENALLEGRAAALLSIQQEGRQTCPRLGADRLITILKQSRTPIGQWPQARS